MSHRMPRWLFAVAATLVSSSMASAQDPIPIGFSPGFSPQGYQPYPAMPYGYPPQNAMPPQYAMPQYGMPPQMMPPYAMPPGGPQTQPPMQQGVVTAALRRHSAPVAAPAPIEAIAPPAAECHGPKCGCSGFLCCLNRPTVPLFDGSHLKSCFADCGILGCKKSHQPLIARRPGPTGIDSVPFHPYARGPRDFFMFYENLEAERSRDLRPALIP